MTKTVELFNGERVPALGLGTWKMGVGDPDEAQQLRALQAGIDHGMTLIDTAEMYGDGRSEQLVAKAIAGRRGEIFLVSKVLPQNASRQGTITACERSLERLGTEMIDLYLLHWRGSHPLRDTVAGFETPKSAGKIRYWGVSNFDVDGMDELAALKSASPCAANQVMYHAASRGIESDLLPHCIAAEVAIMAYSPLGEGLLTFHPKLAAIAHKHGVVPAAIALAFAMRLPGVIAIPKSTHAQRVAENARAADLELDADDLASLDAAFPPPRRKMPLAMT